MAKKTKEHKFTKANGASDVEVILNCVDELKAEIAPVLQEIAHLENVVDQYVLSHFEPGDGLTLSRWKVTKVVSYRRKWDADALEKILPRGIFKRVIKIDVDAAKVKELVDAGKIDHKTIAPAYTETANAPYVKITPKTTDKGEEEAAALAAKLG